MESRAADSSAAAVTVAAAHADCGGAQGITRHGLVVVLVQVVRRRAAATATTTTCVARRGVCVGAAACNRRGGAAAWARRRRWDEGYAVVQRLLLLLLLLMMVAVRGTPGVDGAGGRMPQLRQWNGRHRDWGHGRLRRKGGIGAAIRTQAAVTALRMRQPASARIAGLTAGHSHRSGGGDVDGGGGHGHAAADGFGCVG